MHAAASPKHYDWFSIMLHWVVAFGTIGLFVSGLWMVDLDYYHDWYYRAPWWHKGVGVVVAVLVLLRWLWVLWRTTPAAINTIPRWQRLLAKGAHTAMNTLIIVLAISGYLMVTAKGDPLSVFDWLQIPALVSGKSHWTDSVGTLHLWAGYLIIAIAALHALAALKHHYIDKDATLKRMLGYHTGDNT